MRVYLKTHHKTLFLAILFLSLSATAIIGPFPGGSSGGGGGGSGTVTSVNASVASAPFLSVSGGPITTSGTLSFGLSGTALPVANGGTGATSLTLNNVLLGNGASAPQTVAPSSSGNLLVSNGTTWQSVTQATALAFPIVGSGTASCNGNSAVNVVDPSVTNESLILLTESFALGTPSGAPFVVDQMNGSFNFACHAGDLSGVSYVVTQYPGNDLCNPANLNCTIASGMGAGCDTTAPWNQNSYCHSVCFDYGSTSSCP